MPDEGPLPWTYSVMGGGMMRCCLLTLDRRMQVELDAGRPQPVPGTAFRCDQCTQGMRRAADGFWRWAKP